MPRIYRPVGPSSNKAETGPASNKNKKTTLPPEAKAAGDGKTKGNSGDE